VLFWGGGLVFAATAHWSLVEALNVVIDLSITIFFMFDPQHINRKKMGAFRHKHNHTGANNILIYVAVLSFEWQQGIQ
jgi:hypothetical protein